MKLFKSLELPKQMLPVQADIGVERRSGNLWSLVEQAL
jgi:hypothetical protein